MTTRMVLLLILCMLPATAQADEPLSRAPWKERAVLRAGQIVQGDYFAYADGEIRLTRPVVPAMLTTDPLAVRNDCLCYLMERIGI